MLQDFDEILHDLHAHSLTGNSIHFTLYLYPLNVMAVIHF